MLYEIVRLIVDIGGTLLAGACLLRAWMQYQRLNVHNPLGQFVMTLTDWLVRPLRRVIPGYRGFDWASIAGACVVTLVAVVLLVAAGMASGASDFPSIGFIVGLTLVWLIKWSIYLAQALVLIGAVLSWINPYSPVLPVVDALTGPMLRPIRRLVPMFGRFDLSPLVFLLAMQILLIVLRNVSGRMLGAF